MTLKSVTGSLLSAVAALALGACTTSFNNYRLANDVGNTAAYSMYDDFNRYLASEYSRYVTFKEYQLGVPLSVFDYSDVSHFADKGRAAADGSAVDMEDPAKWHIRNDEDRQMLNGMHRRLGELFAAGSKTRYPYLSAHAQVLFDCNVERGERRWFTGRPEYCDMQELTSLVEMIEGRMNTKPLVEEDVTLQTIVADEATAGQPTEEVAPPVADEQTIIRTIKAEVPRQVLDAIYFAFDSDKIGSDGMEVVQKLVDAVRNGSTTRITVVGYADRAGPAAYNMDLSMRRALAVERALLQEGFPKELIEATGVGEKNLPLKTADGVASARNRVVKIEVAYTEMEEKEIQEQE
ncbi:MAG: OmpA family protein [Proteobacteria bacterium]|nr:OmpA family protein [Pseudomonadota bacterium]